MWDAVPDGPLPFHICFILSHMALAQIKGKDRKLTFIKSLLGTYYIGSVLTQYCIEFSPKSLIKLPVRKARKVPVHSGMGGKARVLHSKVHVLLFPYFSAGPGKINGRELFLYPRTPSGWKTVKIGIICPRFFRVWVRN